MDWDCGVEEAFIVRETRGGVIGAAPTSDTVMGLLLPPFLLNCGLSANASMAASEPGISAPSKLSFGAIIGAIFL